MGKENEPVYVYCVVKSALLRKKNGEVICSIPFSNQFRVFSQTSDGRLYGEAYKPGCGGSAKYRGYVKASGFTKHKVIDMSHLYYRNRTGKRVPTAMRFGGKQTGWIERGERVNVIARTGDWMLTGRGWTRAEWLQKERDIGDYESMKTLVYAIISITVSDYKKIVRGMKAGKRYISKECRDAAREFRFIRKWFHDGEYLKIFEDNMTGDERLEILDKELGVTEEWMKQTLSRRRYREP